MEKELKRVSVVPMRGMVLFPHMTLNFDAAREMSIKALESAAENDSIVFLAAQKDYTIEQPTVDDIYSIGTFAVIKQVMRMPGGITRVIVKGLERGIIENFISEKPFFEAEVQEFDDLYEENHPLKQAYIRRLKKSYEEYFSQNPKLTADNFMAVMGIEEIGELCDVIATSLEIDTKEKQEILSEFDSYDRAEKLIITIQNQLEVLKLEQQLAQKVKERIDKNQREYYLREQLKVIQDELGDTDGIKAEVEEYKQKINKLKTVKDTKEKLMKEVDRFSKMPPSSAESSVLRNYLDTVLSLPWNKLSKESFDIKNAEKIYIPNKNGIKVDVLNKVLREYNLPAAKILKINTNEADSNRSPAFAKAIMALDVCDADLIIARGRLGLPGSGSLLLFVDSKGRILTCGTSPSHAISQKTLEDAVYEEANEALQKIGFKKEG